MANTIAHQSQENFIPSCDPAPLSIDVQHYMRTCSLIYEHSREVRALLYIFFCMNVSCITVVVYV